MQTRQARYLPRTVDWFATIVRIISRMEARLGTVAEPSNVGTVDAVFPLPVQELFFSRQTSLADIVNHSRRNWLSLVVWIHFAILALRSPEMSNITSTSRVLALPVGNFFSGRQTTVSDAIDELVYSVLAGLSAYNATTYLEPACGHSMGHRLL